MQIDAMENAPVSEAVLDHGQKLEGYLRDIAKAKANAMEVKRTEIQPLVEALSKVTAGAQTNLTTPQVARDQVAEASALYEPIVSPDRSRRRTRGFERKSRRELCVGKENRHDAFVGAVRWT